MSGRSANHASIDQTPSIFLAGRTEVVGYMQKRKTEVEARDDLARMACKGGLVVDLKCLVTNQAGVLSMKHVIYLVTVLAWSGFSEVRAQPVGDPQEGLALARQFCSECHAVRREQVHSPSPQAPTFLKLATTPGVTGAALSVALTTPHAGMPMFSLTAKQREDVIAYILDLH